MWNDLQKYLILLSASVLILAGAAEKNNSKKNSPKTSIQKQELTEDMFDPKMFDPMTPKLTKERVNRILEKIDKEYMNYSWPATVKQASKVLKREKGGEKAPDAIALNHFIFSYKSFVTDPELPEVTQTKPAYFNNIGRLLLEYIPVIRQIEYISGTDNNESYKAAVAKYEDISDRMEAAIKDRKRYKIPAVELRTIRNANIARRTKEIAALKKRLGIVEKKQSGKSSRRVKK